MSTNAPELTTPAAAPELTTPPAATYSFAEAPESWAIYPGEAEATIRAVGQESGFVFEGLISEFNKLRAA
jgi:hypothetical protein